MLLPGRTLDELRANPPSMAPFAMPYVDPEGPNPFRDQCVIYFIQGARTRLIKIGRSVNVVPRMADLQSGSPDVLRLLWFYRACIDQEAALHAAFATARVHGEWFKPIKSLVAYIARNEPRHFTPPQPKPREKV